MLNFYEHDDASDDVMKKQKKKEIQEVATINIISDL